VKLARDSSAAFDDVTRGLDWSSSFAFLFLKIKFGMLLLLLLLDALR